jgi:circadian clock protein KaiB
MLAAEKKKDCQQSQETSESSDVWAFRLYVAHQSHKSIIAFANLKDLCEKHFNAPWKIDVIDVCKNPVMARKDQILAIPTLVRMFPQPARRVIGDLSNTNRVLASLNPLSTIFKKQIMT